MERALDPHLLELALGDHRRLPSVGDFSDALESAEIGLLAGNDTLSEAVLPTAWMLHAIASSRYATDKYGRERQRAAFSVSAHAFDLILQQREHPWLDRAQLCFGAEIAYLRSDLNPNSLAIYRRELADDLAGPTLLETPTQYAISCAAAIVGLDSDYLFRATDNIYHQLDDIAGALNVDAVDDSAFGPAGNLVAGCRHLLVYLIYGRQRRLARAEARFNRAVSSRGDTRDRTSQWAAAHLLNLLPGIESSSIWSVLPPSVPSPVRRAFTLAPPQVLTLWPPQLDLIDTSRGFVQSSPFASENTRQFISTPTSGGKTLLAQLIIAAQIQTSEQGVCYVAPTRSLCREVRNTMNRRLRFISRARAENLPDWMDAESRLTQQADIEVMTPERLSFLLRGDTSSVLERFGLFIFDEVHTVGDDERGWTLEQDLAYLHHATRDTDHRIILMSAAVGNRPHFVQWMGGDERVSAYSSNWRGPRQLYAIYTTEPQWEAEEVEPRRSSKYPIRRKFPLEGSLLVRSPQGGHSSIQLDEPVGTLSWRESRSGDRDREADHSTSNYRTLIPLIEHLERLGPVLVIQATKRRARFTAQAVAEQQPDDLDPPPELVPLLDLVDARLGPEHPIRSVLERGVAYHHGSLPSEIRQGIEDAVSDGSISVTVATTTMTEGVNLPVRSVVLGSQGFYTEEGYTEHIVGSRLLNAIGRAGRAARETEGIIVIAKFRDVDETDFDEFRPEQEELRVDSFLRTSEALDNLAEFERMAREAEDAVIEAGTGAVSSFLAYVWFIAAELERLERPITMDSVANWLEATLGWVQLDDADRERWLRAATIAVAKYEQTDPATRQRWARSGTSVSTASRLDDLAHEVANSVQNAYQEVETWTELILLILADNRLDEVLEISDASKVSIYSSRGGTNRQKLDIDLRGVLRGWLEGMGLVQLADQHLSDVNNIEYRFEQLGDLINDVFEIHLPWMLRVIVDWVNVLFSGRGLDFELSRDLPALLRWGVPDLQAARLMSRGLSSRRFAVEIANEWSTTGTHEDIENWVRRLPRAEWRERFTASVAELRSLVSIIRPQTDDILTPFLRGETIFVPVAEIEGVTTTPGPVAIPVPPEEYAEVELHQEGRVIATVRGSHHADVMAILQMEVGFEAEIVIRDDGKRLGMTLLDPDESSR